MGIEIACPDPDMVVLAANRGEIARRVIRAAQDWGVRSIAVYADPDAAAPHVADADTAVRIGPAALAESYLSIDAILAAARETNATHVHPGYGFLAENAAFADAVVDAGLTWVGPAAPAIARMGSKIEARGIAQSAGVPVIPGFDASQSDAELAAAAADIGYPVLIKASAGGGGKGIRIVHAPDDFAAALEAARSEAARAFADDAVIVERYITRPRHIEVQVAGDRDGEVVDLGTRECSVQRRYQKVLEEAPAVDLPPETSQGLRAAAVTLSEAIGYDSIGTVEFILDDVDGDWYFLEMNTRVQVEHTVTEEITGVDLVQLQLALASGSTLPADIRTAFDASADHAIEVRINAENPWSGFTPDTGTVDRLDIPTAPFVRWDAAVEAGSTISPHYDSMIGKLIVSGPSRLVAIDRLESVLAATVIDGVETTLDFHRWLLTRPTVRSGGVTTRFLDETPLPRRSPYGHGAPSNPWDRTDAARLTPHVSKWAFESSSRDGSWALTEHAGGAATATLLSPFPGLIAEVFVEPGDFVENGQTLLTIEAMKMLHPITAHGHGAVASVLVSEGQQVAAGDELIVFDAPPTDAAPDDGGIESIQEDGR